jgi:hypothetical protein
LVAVASAKSWRIADFHDQITIGGDGTALVQEHIVLVFIGEWHGIHRTIPVEFPGPRGTNYTLFVDLTSITDENGNHLKYEASGSGDFRDFKIYIAGAVDTTRTVNIEYIVKNGVRYFADHDEFYWNVTGNDWPVPIDHVSATVRLPANTAGSLRAQAFTGVYGSTSHEVTTKVEGATAEFETTNPLPMRGGMTIDLYIPKGLLTEPGLFTRVGWFLGSNPILFLPVATLAVMFSLWWLVGRDPDPGMSVAPLYEPPAGISPAESGTLIDDSIHPRDITSTLVDLAVRGYMKIEETVEKGLIFHHKDYIFHLLKPREQWGADLQPHERVMLENLYTGGGTMTRLSGLKNHFYTAIPVIRQDIMSELKNKGMYMLDPESANGYSIVAGIAILALFAVAQFLGWANFFSSILLLVICLLTAAIIWWLFARVMTAKTVKGGRTRIAILGFQEFMTRVDADRLKRMPPNTFEKYLPYAMALGVEHSWAQKFAGIIKDPPQWYVSPNGMMFNPVMFSTNMHSFAGDVHQAFVAAPRASATGSGWSGGGGFGGGGGGFSGGGFGGGGGSAF